MARLKRLAAALTLLAALALAAAALTVALQGFSAHDAKRQAQQTLVVAAVRADNAAANNAPVPNCNPAPGAGKLGACAPPSGPSATLAKAAGDPFTVHGLLGVDISSYQGCDNQLRGISFAFFKASEGTGYTDVCLRRNVQTAKAHRLPYGVYDFLRPSYQHSAAQEAAHFVAAVRAAGANTSLPPVADVEANAGLSGAALHNYVCSWHGYVERALHRKTDITYTGNWFWGPQVAGGSCGTLLWVSAYANYAVIPHGWRTKTIWQYSDGVFGPYPHINGWDSDVFQGTRAQLAALANRKPPVPPVPAHARHLCQELYNLKRLSHRHRLSGHGHRRGVAIVRYMGRQHLKCTVKGKAPTIRRVK
jgi:lysozyme